MMFIGKAYPPREKGVDPCQRTAHNRTPTPKKRPLLGEGATNVARLQGQGEDAGKEPDVPVDGSELAVDRISPEVEDLRAYVSVLAELANLVNLSVGVDARLDRVLARDRGCGGGGGSSGASKEGRHSDTGSSAQEEP
jgi:hypothetical protein